MKRTIFTILLLLAVLLCRTPPLQAVTYDLEYYINNRGYLGSGGINDAHYNIYNEIFTYLDGSAGVPSWLLTPGTAPTGEEGMLYADDSSNALMFHNGTSWLTVGLLDASSYSLDTAYNNGSTIDVDGDAVTLTVSSGDNNRVLDLVQNDSSSNPETIRITNAGSGDTIQLVSTGGKDVDGTSSSWSVTHLGVGSFLGLVAGASDITLENAEYIDNGTNNKIIFDSDTSTVEDFAIGLGANTNIITFSSGSGANKIELGTLDDVNGVGNIYFDSAASQITLAANETADDLTIQVTGAFDASLDLRSAGTGGDAIKIYASAGGLDIDTVAETIHIQNAATGAGEDITIALTGATNSSIILTSAGNAGDAMSFITTSATGDFNIDSSDEMDIDSVGSILIDISEAAADFRVDSALGSVYLEGAEAAADALVLYASNAAGGIDADAGTAGIAVDTTGAFSVDGAAASNVSVVSGATDENLTVSVTGATLSSLILSSAGTGDDAVDLNGTAGGLDADFVKSIAFTSTENSPDAVKLQATLGGIDILADASDGEAIDIVNTGGPLNLKSTEEGDASIHIETTTATGQIQITSTDTTADGIEVDSTGGIDIDAGITADITINAGQLLLEAEHNVASAISLITNTGTTETIVILNSQGNTDASINVDSTAGGLDVDVAKQLSLVSSENAVDAVQITASAGGIDILATSGGSAEDIDITATGGSVNIIANESAAQTIVIATTGGGSTAETIDITNDTGTSASATSETDAAIQIEATVGGISLESGLSAADAIRLETDGAAAQITIQAINGVGASATTQEDASIQLYSEAGGIGLTSGLGGADAIRIEAQTALGLITVQNIAGVGASATGEEDASIQLYSQVGGIGITSGLSDVDAIRIETQSAASILTIASAAGTTDDAIALTAAAGGITAQVADDKNLTLGNAGGDAYFIVAPSGTAGNEDVRILNTNGTAEAAIDIQATAGGIFGVFNDAKDFNFEGGQFLLTANHNTGDTIKLHADAGASQTIVLLNDGGTSEAAIALTSTAGGITGIFNDAKDFNFEGGQFLLTGNHNTGDTIKLHADAGASQTIVLLNDEGTGTGAVTITATAGGIDINGGAGNDITIDTSKSLVVTTTEAAASQIVLDATGAASGTAVQISTTDGAILLDADGATYGDILMEVVDDIQMTIGGHFRIVDDDLMAFGTGDDVTLNYDEDGNDDLQIKGPVSFETTLCKFDSQPTYSSLGSNATPVWGGAATGTAGDENVMMFPEATFVYHIIGDNTAELGPTFRDKGALETSAFDISFEDADGEGVEIVEGDHNVGGTRTNFTIGTDAFYLKVKIYLTDSSGIEDLWVGFRLLETFQAAVNTYNSFAMIGGVKETVDLDFKTETYFNAGSLITTDLTETNWADTTAHELGIYVSAAKAVTYTVDGVAASGAAGFTWTDLDIVVPFLYFEHNTDIAQLTFLQSWECGLQ